MSVGFAALQDRHSHQLLAHLVSFCDILEDSLESELRIMDFARVCTRYAEMRGPKRWQCVLSRPNALPNQKSG